MTLTDASGDKPGLIDLLGKGVFTYFHAPEFATFNSIFEIKQEFDIVTGTTPTPSRTAIVEFTHPLVHLSISFLIPSSSLSVNILSATKPFQVWVRIFKLNFKLK